MKTHLWIHADCLDHLKTIKSDSIQLVITSPPYGIKKAYEKTNDLEDTLSLQQAVLKECHRVLSPNGSICWQVGNHVSPNTKEKIPWDILLYPYFQTLGLTLRNRIIWTFGHGLHAKNALSNRYETICWLTKSKDYYFNLDAIRIPQKYPNKKYFKGPRKGELSCNPLGKNPGDVWDIVNVKHNHPEKTSHPCQFPLELVDRLVLSLSRPDDIVLDPFGGVATTVISAINNNRIGIGIELDINYYNLGKERILSATPKTYTQPLSFS